MNNQQFRRLLLDNADAKSSAATADSGTTPSSLGSRKTGFTPRGVKGGADGDFVRQMRERNAALQPSKRFKSAAPKGVKLGSGYTDRAKARAEAEDDEDDKAKRVKALEEQLKLGSITQQVFEEQRDAITGGDLESTHLVKGLDRKLLERVRRGEDVFGTRDEQEDEEPPLDADKELDRLAEKEVEAVKKVAVDKKGNTASPATLAGTKRSRDEIMAELKAQRKAAAEAKASKFADGRWKKIGETVNNKVQIDHRGREVLITVDEDGVVKKKVRRVAPKIEEETKSENVKPLTGPLLGSDVVIPSVPKPDAIVDEEDDDDIFEGVGVEYNPLGDEDDDDGSSDEDEDEKNAAQTGVRREAGAEAQAQVKPTRQSSVEDPTHTEQASTVARNYFKNTKQATEEDGESKEDRLAGVQQLLKKAAKLDSASTANADEDDDDEISNDQAARLKKRAQMLAQQDRDFEDMDMGFGSSRYDDGEDEADSKVKLSEWKGDDAQSDDGKKGGANKTKRKPKKRKGDANNMADIMRVIDGRKGGKGK